MKIETKILWTMLAMSLLVALIGALAVNRQRAAAFVGATKEAQDFARLLSVLLLSESDRHSAVELQAIVMRLHGSEHRDVALMDSNQLILADAVPEEIGTIFSNDPHDEVGATIKDRRVRTFVEISRAYPAGIRQIVVPAEDASGAVTGAVVMEYTPLYSELMRLAKTMIYQVALAGIGGILVAALIAWWMGRSIARPLRQLATVATGFADGRSDLLMPPPRKDEIGGVARAFNGMMEKRNRAEDKLRRLGDELEIRVAERTTELAVANQALRAQNTERQVAEEKYRSIFENSIEGIYQSTPEGEFLAVNPAAARIFGFSDPRQLLGKTDRTGYGYVDPNRIGEFLHLIAKTDFVNGFESEVCRRDGSKVWVSENVRVVRRGDDSIHYYEGTLVDITERKKAEQTLLESEEKFRQLADNVADVFYITSPDFREMHYVSPAYEKVWGQSVESLYADPAQWSEAILPEERAGVVAAFARLATDAPSVSRMFRIARPDGAIRWIFSRGFQIKNAAGEVIRIIGNATDVTEHKRAEEAIRKGEARYRKLFEENPLPLWVYDLATLSFLEVNDAAIAHYGYTREEFLAMTISDIRPPAERARLHADLARVHSDAPVNSEPWQHRKKDGALIDVEINSHRFEHDGRPARLVLALDVTERAQAEKALREAETKFRSLFENSSDGIFQNTPEGRMVSANPALARMLGYGSPEELIRERTSLTHQSYVEPGLREGFQRRLEEQGSVNNFEYEIRRKDGTKISVSENTRLVRDAAGEAVLYEGSLQDITERKRSEAERQVISEIMQGVVTPNNLSELLALAHRSIGRLLYAENCFVGLHDATTDLINFEFWIDQRDPVPAPQPIANGFTRSSYVLRTGLPLLLTAARRDQLFEGGQLAQSGSNSASWLGVPLRTPTRTIGVLAVQHYEEDDVYSERDVEFLSAVGNQIALAIERKLAEETLRQSEQAQREIAIQLESERARLVEAQAVAKVGSWETDLATHSLIWSAETYRIFETCPAKFDRTHAAFLEIVHPDDRAAVNTAFAASAGQAGPFSIQHRLLFPDQRITFVEERWQIVCDEQGQEIRAVGTCQDITERKRAELEIERTLDRLNAAQRVGKIGDWEWDIASGEITWSPQVFDLFGRDPQLGPPPDYEAYLALYDAENGALLQDSIAGALQTGETQTHEVGVRRPDGGQAYLEGMVVPRKNDDGILLGLFGTVQDITARKRAEEQTRKSEVSLGNAQRIAHLGSWEYDLASGALHWSDEVYRIFGVSAQEFIPSAETFFALIHPEDRAAVRAASETAVAAGTPYNIDHRIIHGDGSERIVHEQAEIAFGASGAALCMVGTVQDITERKQAEAVLRVQAHMLDNVGQAVIATDPAGQVTYANRFAEQLYGWPSAEILGRSIMELTVSQNTREQSEQIMAQLRRGDQWSGELPVRRRDGTEFQAAVSNTPLRGEQGELIGIVGISEDITVRQQAEEALRESEERFRAVAEQSFQGLVLYQDGITTFVNRAFCEITGLSTDEALAQTPAQRFAMIHPDNSARVLDRKQRFERGEPTEEVEEILIIRKDGALRWVLSSNHSFALRGKPARLGILVDITERKRAEASLAASESRYHSLFENMLEGYAYCRTQFEGEELRDFTYLEVNSAFEKLTGLKDAAGKKVSELLPGLSGSNRDVFEVYGRVALTGKPEKYETYVGALDSWLSITVYSSEPEHFVAVFDNITTRKRAEEALQRSEEEFRTLAEAMPQIVWVSRADGWNTYISQQWMDYTGLGSEESLGHGWHEALHPADRVRGSEAWQQAFATGSIYSLECRIRRADGEYRWWLVRAVPLQDAQSHILKWFGTCTDIHDLKLAGTALRESNEKFQQLVDNITDVFWIRSPDAKEVQYVSPAFERIWGRTVESLYTNPTEWTDFIFPEDRAAVIAAFAGLTKETSSIDLEYRIFRPDDELRWVRVRGFQVRDDAGTLIRLIGIVTDISSRKLIDGELAQSRAALQQLNVDLELRVAQRTTDLVSATEAADRANLAKSQFLSRTSHELRTPLNAILGFGQLLELEENFDSDTRESVEQILNAGRHLLSLIDEVLDISNAESGSIVLAHEPLEVEQLLTEALSLVRPLCSTLRVQLEPPKFLEGDWFVLADRQRLRQVLLNLLGNAIKYNRPGGSVRVECALVADVEPPAFRFCVKDTGPGISAANLPRLFTPFERLEADRKQPHIVGTGLGLSLSRRLMELMGGTIGVESVEGVGSTFWFDVPLCQNALAETARS